jgi:flavin-dependent dehydrogenase
VFITLEFVKGADMRITFKLDAGKDPQHYGIGIKELWDIPADKHQQGLVIHTAGWPLSESGSMGGGFLYHLENNQMTAAAFCENGVLRSKLHAWYVTLFLFASGIITHVSGDNAFDHVVTRPCIIKATMSLVWAMSVAGWGNRQKH